MVLLGFESMIYYSIYDYIKLYFIDFKVCNKENYEEIFGKEEDKNLFSNYRSNLFTKLEQKSIEIAIHSSKIFLMNSYYLYCKGLAVVIYSFDILRQTYSFDSKQVQFVDEWVSKYFIFNCFLLFIVFDCICIYFLIFIYLQIRFLINQANSVFSVENDTVIEIYNLIKDYFIHL